MPEYTVRWILGRALSDPAYRELMAHDPSAAWQGYELTDEDLAELKRWTPERIEWYLADMEANITGAVFDGVTGFELDETPSPFNCDEAFSLDELKRLFGGELN
ncbi:MAG TPA: Os1348 family NHLP clan protein [Syntrophorhabdales bacterium]|nr:Os1348 family NHLP clan protein [Syntrophorhabdales bacterium]